MLLLRTVHGSHLYGLNHPGSDLDYYEVRLGMPGIRKRKGRQTIVGNLDTHVVDLSTFREFCDLGVPQALEALFSPVAEVDLLTAFRFNYYVNLSAARATYERTARNFEKSENPKMQRHARRLRMNLETMMEFGRFNPQLTPSQLKELIG